MKRSARLKLVEQVTQAHEQKAAQVVAVAQQALEREQERLQALAQYQLDYQQQGASRGQQGMSINHFLTIQGFLDQIDTLTQQQEYSVSLADQQLQQAKAAWLRLYHRRKSIAQLAEKVELQEWLVQEKQEQKILDDLIVQMQSRK